MGIAINIERTYKYSAVGNKIHHNIVINTRAGVSININHPEYNTYYIDELYIYNNLFIDNRDNIAPANSTKYSTRNITYRNNLSYVNSDLASHTTSSNSFPGWTISNNSWYGGTLPSGDWRDKTDIYDNPKLKKTSWRDTESLNNQTFTISDLLPSSDWAGVAGGVNLGADYDDAWSPSSALPPNNSFSEL